MAKPHLVDEADTPVYPIVNTHVHLPPNFSAFETPEAAISAAHAENVRVVGASNFHDQRVYRRFADAARAAGILPLFGLEFITVVDDLLEAEARVNDPGNPGRMYLCGKGIEPFGEPTGVAAADRRARPGRERDPRREMVAPFRDHFAAAGLTTSLDNDADHRGHSRSRPRSGDWVVLQERHVADGVPGGALPAGGARAARRTAGTRLRRPPAAPVEDPAAVQGEIRSRLLKAGRPAFVRRRRCRSKMPIASCSSGTASLRIPRLRTAHRRSARSSIPPASWRCDSRRAACTWRS